MLGCGMVAGRQDGRKRGEEVMPRFSRAEDAFEWAWIIVDGRRNGRSNTAIKDMISARGLPMGFSWGDAIDIHYCAKRACQGERTCPTYSAACLIDWWMPMATDVPKRKSDHEVQRINNCIAAFEDELWEMNFLEEAPRRRR